MKVVFIIISPSHQKNSTHGSFVRAPAEDAAFGSSAGSGASQLLPVLTSYFLTLRDAGRVRLRWDETSRSTQFRKSWVRCQKLVVTLKPPDWWHSHVTSAWRRRTRLVLLLTYSWKSQLTAASTVTQFLEAENSPQSRNQAGSNMATNSLHMSCLTSEHSLGLLGCFNISHSARSAVASLPIMPLWHVELIKMHQPIRTSQELWNKIFWGVFWA